MTLTFRSSCSRLSRRARLSSLLAIVSNRLKAAPGVRTLSIVLKAWQSRPARIGCRANGRTPLAKCSGRESGKARDAGRSERTLGQPSCEAIKVEGRGGRHVLQACLGQPTVARLA
jgi:hypothetical protein